MTDYWWIDNGWHGCVVRPLEFVKEYGNRGNEILVFRRPFRPTENIKVPKAHPSHPDFGKFYTGREAALAEAKVVLEGSIRYFEERIVDARKRLQNLK